MNCYAYYEAQTTHTIKIDYVFADTENQAFDSYIATVANGDAFKAEVTSPILEGYTIDQPTVQLTFRVLLKMLHILLNIQEKNKHIL